MRLPYQVIVIPYRMRDTLEYCVLKRMNHPMRQWVSGGGEDLETSYEAAVRELFEETGVKNDELIRLESLTYIPSHWFKRVEPNYPDVLVVPEYSFGVHADQEIVLSEEHDKYDWMTYEEAVKVLTWDSNKTALYELNEILKSQR